MRAMDSVAPVRARKSSIKHNEACDDNNDKGGNIIMAMRIILMIDIEICKFKVQIQVQINAVRLKTAS